MRVHIHRTGNRNAKVLQAPAPQILNCGQHAWPNDRQSRHRWLLPVPVGTPNRACPGWLSGVAVSGACPGRLSRVAVPGGCPGWLSRVSVAELLGGDRVEPDAIACFEQERLAPRRVVRLR